jgi:hypothetical protein
VPWATLDLGERLRSIAAGIRIFLFPRPNGRTRTCPDIGKPERFSHAHPGCDDAITIS